MKKILAFICAVSALIAASTSCAKIEDPQNHGAATTRVNAAGEYAILFGERNSATKATVTTTAGNGYDEFSLFTWNSNGEMVMNPYLISATGTDAYAYDETPGQELKYFSNAAASYEFIGVVPTTHTMTYNAGEVKVEGIVSFLVDDNRVTGTITADSPEEFLWSYKQVARADYGSTVALPFNHGNSLIYFGFSSDRDDTEIIDYVPAVPAIPATPEVRDTTDTWFNLKRSSGNVDGSATKTRTKTGDTWGEYVDNYELPAALVAEIKSYYSVDGGAPGDYDLHLGASVWPSSEIKKLRIVKAIPAEYKLSCQIYTTDIVVDFFDGFKYLKDNGYDIQPRNSGGKPDVWDYVLLDAFVNGTAYTVVGMNATGSSYSVPEYTIDVTPGTPEVPGKDAISGVRLFTANSTPDYCTHIAHTTVADATITSAGMTYDNRTTSTDVVTFSLPATTTLSSAPKWSASTFYAVPGDTDLNYLVVKLSYIYNGITTYDVRVPIELPAGGMVAGKYYKYEIYITSTGNGTYDPDEATADEDDIEIINNPVISVKLVDAGYTEGADQKITI